MRYLAIPLAAALLSACSSQDDNPSAATQSEAATEAIASPASDKTASPGPKTLTLEGLGGLTIGQPVPANSSFTAGDGQIGNGCETLSSPEWPGVYAIRTNGEVRRISVADGSGVKL